MTQFYHFASQLTLTLAKLTGQFNVTFLTDAATLVEGIFIRLWLKDNTDNLGTWPSQNAVQQNKVKEKL